MDADQRTDGATAVTCASCGRSTVLGPDVERAGRADDLGCRDHAAHLERPNPVAQVIVDEDHLDDDPDGDGGALDRAPRWWERSDPVERDLAIQGAARARRVPWLAGAATGALGCAAWGTAELAGAWIGAGAHDVVVTGTVVGTAVALPAMWVALRRSIPEGWRGRWWLSGAAAAAWVDVTAAVTGPTVPMLCALGLGGASLSRGWMAAHEPPAPSEVTEPLALPAPESVLELPPVPVPAPLPVPVEPSRADQLEDLFYARVAGGKNPAAAGATLPSRVDLPHGTQWRVQLDPNGTVGATEFVGLRLPIARKLQIKATHVILEEGAGEKDGEDIAVMTLVTRDVLRGGVRYQGPDYRDGVIRIGLFADGSGPAEWKAYSKDDGPKFGLVIGGSGSGKSSTLGLLGMAYRFSGEWTVLFGDGDQEGNSSPLLSRVAHDFASGPEVLQQLEAVEAWLRMRGELMPTLTAGPDGKPIPRTDPRTQEQVDKILPCPNYPGLVWFLDELHDLAVDPELQEARFAKRLGRVSRTIRKHGGKIIVGTQGVGDFGADGTFRSVLAAGNLVLMRTGDRTQHYAVSDGPSPHTLPEQPGYGFLETSGRRAMFRTEHDENMAQWVPRLPATRPDRRAAQILARYRPQREADPVLDHEEAMRRVAATAHALETGAPLPGEQQEEQAEASTAIGRITVGGVEIPAVGGSSTGRGEGTVIPMQRPQESPPARQPVKVRPIGEFGTRAAAADQGPLSDRDRAVLEALESRPGPWTSAELIEATGRSGSRVSEACKALVRRGLAHQPTGKQGRYAAGPAPATSVQA